LKFRISTQSELKKRYGSNFIAVENGEFNVQDCQAAKKLEHVVCFGIKPEDYGFHKTKQKILILKVESWLMSEKRINYQAWIWSGLIKRPSKISVKIKINMLEMIKALFEENLLLPFSKKKLNKLLFLIEKQRFLERLINLLIVMLRFI